MKDAHIARFLTASVALILIAGCGKSWKQFAYEGMDRDGWQHPERVMEVLEIQPGDQVADLGAGSGYFTFDLAKAAGPDGVVYAVDIDPEMIALIDELATEKSVSNVKTILAKPDDPGLPDGAIDLVFTSNTYHHIADPTAYFAKLKTDLAPNGRVAILDLRPDSGWFQRWFGHASEAQKIRDEMKAAGYQLQGEQDFVEKQSFLVFAPTPTS
ncbi:MAG: methyltransferase domain-containing protein [Candidatus Binatia bacterium]|nr:methyltransferase domain-containing protein [Candidatus Binatia bacterium]